MGEYIYLQGEPDTRKLGTCEELFYVRYADLVRWVGEGRAQRVPGNLEPAAYLDEKHGFRFRFPFPDEDGAAWAALDYDRGFPLDAPAVVFAEMEHNNPPLRRVAYSVGDGLERGEGACTQEDAATRGGRVELVAQRLIDGLLWAVVRCPGCGAKWRLTPERAQALAAAHRAAGDATTREVVRRMLAGYGAELTPTAPAAAGAEVLRTVADMARARPGRTPDGAACHHPAARLWAWYADDCQAPSGRVLCVACCDCGAVLAGAAQEAQDAQGDAAEAQR